ncbi:hypothetical protein [Mycolicibacterium mageritense]|uniref:hypothetical protein n=1 Tax=Mycolicibacterium mageritense TaxID=53462 RepID=UPI001E5998A1|nr:hypothetical protein [Mycolicibacterium mageritense]
MAEPLMADKRIDEFDWDIVRYVVEWAPYGGPLDEDILPRFGMDAQRLDARFIELVSALTLHSGTLLNHRQRRLLARARELIPPEKAGTPIELKERTHHASDSARCDFSVQEAARRVGRHRDPGSGFG